MDTASILLVDDDTACRSMLATRLREQGHTVDEVESAERAVRAVNRNLPDLMILESLLPDGHGVDLLRDVKCNDQLRLLRILLLSRRPASEDVVRALEQGAEDFVPKPFVMEELLARIGACLRRPVSAGAADLLSAGRIAIDRASHRVSVDDRPLSLTPREYRLLSFLVANPDRVYSRNQLLLHVWDRGSKFGARTVDVYVRRLRKHLEAHDLSHYIQTVRGSGYRFSLKDG
jgi:two-component system phosphate regulon response regulator PhoB